jgi:hypothetical protein
MFPALATIHEFDVPTSPGERLCLWVTQHHDVRRSVASGMPNMPHRPDVQLIQRLHVARDKC